MTSGASEPYLPAALTDAVIDLSHHNPEPIDFAAVAAAGITAVILKASQGAAFVDPYFARRRAAAAAAGLLVGAYHFLDGSDPMAQAQRFHAAIGDPRGLLLALDLEAQTASPPGAAAIADAMQAQIGQRPVIYTGRAFCGLPHAGLATCELWLPEYGTRPICPPGWRQWRLWQYTAQGRVPGVTGWCDRSRFAGSAAELAAWWAGNAV